MRKELRASLFYLALGVAQSAGAFIGDWHAFSHWIGGVLLGIGAAETFHAFNTDRVRS